MKTEAMLIAVNGIDSDLIEKYYKTDGELELKKSASGKRRFIKWGSIAACFILLLVCIPSIVQMFVSYQSDDSYRRGIEYKINSISELPAEYKGKLLVQNLDLTENAQIELYYKEGGSAENSDDWFSLIISDTVYSDTVTEIIDGNEIKKAKERLLLHCFFDGRTKEEQKVDMVFTEEATDTVVINGVDVQIARNGMSLELDYWYYAVFEYDGVVYDVRTKSNSREYIYDVLNRLIKK